MPELPDITVYIEALEKRIVGQTLQQVRIVTPFLLRTATPPLDSTFGKKVISLRRLGKRICIGLEGELWLVLHLMIAGRLHWTGAGETRRGGRTQSRNASAASVNSLPRVSRNGNFAAFDFSNGSLLWSEAGSQKRASLHVAAGEDGLRDFDPGGLEVLENDAEAFARTLRFENHTVKRALTDPTLFSGIGNAYSDEILWESRLSPMTLTQKMTAEETQRLYEATRQTLNSWVERLRADAGNSFPEGVTAFRPEMAVHGKYKQPCPRCGTPVQRIKYASNETNYCPACQTGGKLLADRAFSRVLRDDWPRTLEELENKMAKDRNAMARNPSPRNPDTSQP